MEPNPANIVIDGGDDPVYQLTDVGLVASTKPDEILVPKDKFESGGYAFKDNQVIDKTGKPVSIDDTWFKSFTVDKPTSQIMIDDVAYILDEKGNAITPDGKIFKTSDEINALENSIEIDGKLYRLDANGNAINEDNSIFKAAAEIQALLEAQAEPFNISDIFKQANIVIPGEDGKPIQYENSTDGLVKALTDAFNFGGTIKGSESFNKIIQELPELPNIVQHLRQYGTIEGYNQREDYSNIQLNPEDKDGLKQIIIRGKIAKGETKEEAERIAKYTIDDGKGMEVAKSELAFLQRQQSIADAAALKAIQDERKNQLRNHTQVWGITYDENGRPKVAEVEGSIYDKVVKKGTLSTPELKEVNIPEIIRRNINGKVVTADRKEFFDYIYRVKQFNIDGHIEQMSQYDYDTYLEDSKFGTDKYLVDALKKFSGKSFDDILAAQVKQSKLNEIKKLYTSGRKGGTNRNTKDNVEIRVPSHIARL